MKKMGLVFKQSLLSSHKLLNLNALLIESPVVTGFNPVAASLAAPEGKNASRAAAHYKRT